MYNSIMGIRTRGIGAAASIIVAISASASFPGCSAAARAPVMKPSKDSRSFVLRASGSRRTGALFVPPSYDGTKPFYLVIGLHGANGSGEAFRGLGLDAAAAKYDWIVAYPDGAQGRWEGPEEAPFIANLIEAARASYKIDSDRVYLVGHSAGAIFAYEAAAALGPRVRAIAFVAGLARIGTTAAGPVSILHIHARDDVSVPYGGDETYGFLSAEDSVALWRGIDAASPEATPYGVREGIEGRTWKGAEADVALLSYDSGGHVWLPMATDYIAEFFYSHPPRGTSLRLSRESLPSMIMEYSPLLLRVELSAPRIVKTVQYFSNGASIGAAESFPFSFEWDNPQRGRHELSAIATLESGERVASVFDPSVLAAKPVIGPDGKPKALPRPLRAVSAFASSIEEDQYEARYAIDGSVFTRWSSLFKDGQSITIDLGFERTVSGASLFWEKAYAVEYSIDLSTDGKSWIGAVAVADGPGGEEYRDFAPRKARFVRMSGKVRRTEWGFSLWEFTAHGE